MVLSVAGRLGTVALEGISKRYASAEVIQDLSVSVAPGEFFTLLGPSGSGKSTTLAIVAGFVLPDAGRVLLGGQDMTFAPPRVRGLGMVFQNYAIFPHLNVFENVAFPLRVRRPRATNLEVRVAVALEMVKLTGLERRFGHQLSGGQQQRVALARAIVAEPRIVLMDEPLGALDKNLRYHMQMEIKDIQRRLGMTVLFVTHDQEEAMNMSDRIAIMDQGRIVQMGSPRQVYEQPDSVFVARFLGEANLVTGQANGDTLRTDCGAVLRATNRLPEPGSARLFVRPEKLSLSEADGSAVVGENRLIGKVSRVSFLGSIVRYQLAVAGGNSVTVDVVNGSGTTLVPLGAVAIVRWPVADSRLLGV